MEDKKGSLLCRPVGFPMMDDKSGSLFMPDWLVLVGLLVDVLRGQNCVPLSTPVGLLCAYMPC